jgi:predicted aconitase/predicted aconitase with swiveling domain
MVEKIKARIISSGYSEGEALICSQPLGFNHGVVIETGVIKEQGHELEGISIKDKVLIFPHGHGSTGGSYVVYQLAKAGTGPNAVINLNTENIIAVGAIMGGMPVVDHMEKDPFSFIKNGDWIRVDAVQGTVEVIPKDTPYYPKGQKAAQQVMASASGSSNRNIKLTDEEKRMLNGEMGEPVAVAMNMLVSLGEIYGAEKMVPISSAHIAGLSLKSHGKAGMLWAEDMAQKGAKVRVPTSGNVIGVDRSRDFGMPSEWVAHQMRIEKAYETMGMLGTSTCTPYFCGIVPKLGEIVAWAESSAVVYANSILGARDNREGGPSALAAAITGRVPYCGYHLDENRKGDVLFKVTAELKDMADFGALGHYVGKIIGEKIPVFENVGNPPMENLVALGAALASWGGVALYHVLGVTPEAMNKEVVFGKKQYETIEIGKKELEQAYARMSRAKKREVNFVVIGCPHASIRQVAEVAALLDGKRLKDGVMMWIQVNAATKGMASLLGYMDVIEKAGAALTQDLCAVLAVPEALGATTAATNSGKFAFYAPGANQLEIWYGDVQKCVRTALTGFWND